MPMKIIIYLCFNLYCRTFIGNPVHYDAKMTCDELAGKVRTNFQLYGFHRFMIRSMNISSWKRSRRLPASVAVDKCCCLLCSI